MTRPKLLNGDVRQELKKLHSESIHCVVTSPPYWGLRDYGSKDQLGLEKTPEQYIDNMVKVFREVKRVLRNDGTVWLNLGDSYAGSNGSRGITENTPSVKKGDKLLLKRIEGRNFTEHKDGGMPIISPDSIGLKHKDLVGIPWRVALALQADGWYLRSDIIWNKPNPMPEPVKDRPTKSHEYIFLLTKSAKYYYDHEAIKEPYSESSIERINQVTFDSQTGGDKDYGKVSVHSKNTNSIRGTLEKFKENLGSGRNRRSVWDITVKSYPGAHFATFPEEIPELCIKAGTSEGGCCLECGTPYNRIVEKGEKVSSEDYKGKGKKDYASALAENPSDVKRRTLESMRQVIYKGWEAGCDCEGVKIPCTVLDPFAGSGTTCAVASRLGRDSIGIELNEEYLKLARKRCKIESESLFNYV
jgi:DNA modification methylase